MQHLTPSHTLLLNKFNVVPHHVLVVTKHFEKQTEPLNLQDMQAVWQTMQVLHQPALGNMTARLSQSIKYLCAARMQAYPDGALAYFNCGPESGASQPHKHIQVRLAQARTDSATCEASKSELQSASCCRLYHCHWLRAAISLSLLVISWTRAGRKLAALRLSPAQCMSFRIRTSSASCLMRK